MPKPGERGFARALGDIVGVSYKGAEKWLKGDGMPDMGNAAILAKRLNVQFEWLMTGRGRMNGHEYMAKEPPQKYTANGTQPKQESPASIDEIAKKLPPEVQVSIRNLVEVMVKTKPAGR